jgi:formyltetrahydrofolate-dependent phosphoribosylglycinamide formyltransferase
MRNLAVFISGGGPTLKRIIDACNDKEIDFKVGLVVSSNGDAKGIDFARSNHIDVVVVNDDIDLVAELNSHHIDLIVLAGYLKLIGTNIIEEYRNKIINVHPSLLPLYGGKGMYGIRVHQAVIEGGETKSGATVHYVDENFDTGKIIEQCVVDVEATDTAETLQERIKVHEKELLINVLKDI